MLLANLPKMFLSETQGWSDIQRMRTSVFRLYAFFVIPMSLIPAIMYSYSDVTHAGGMMPVISPPLSFSELVLGGIAFLIVELAMVALMAAYIQQIGESVDFRPSYQEATLLAAIAPTPLWVSSLALFIPNVGVNVAVLVLAWIGTVALIRHGIRPIMKLEDEAKAHRMANAVIVAGIFAWVVLMLLFALMLSVVLGSHRVI
jgi:hypothetical protein